MELITPPDDTCIMNGVIRRTILEQKDMIEKKYNVRLIEREISIHEVINSSKEGRLFEVFGTATHCHSMPITRIVYQDTSVMLSKGPVCSGISTMMNDIMVSNDKKWVTTME